MSTDDVSSETGGHGALVSSSLARAAERIDGAERLLITSHRRPDGDAIGSMIALASLMRERGKTAVLYNPDQVQRRYKWLPLARGFRRKLGKEATYQATVVVDCAEARLLGNGFPGPEVTGDVIVLDHHSSAVPFGDIYVCDPEASSVGLLVVRLARALGWPMNHDAAMGVYFSLASDTGSFRYANTTAEAMRVAADMIDLGVDPWLVNENLHESVSLGRYRLLSALFEGIEFEFDGRVAFFILNHELLRKAGATWEDSIDLVNYARTLAGVECGVLLSPTGTGKIRVSLRSKGHIIDAGDVCVRMGGGGHRGAAGTVIDEKLPDVRARVVRELGLVFEAHDRQQPRAPKDASDDQRNN